jgi:hypothetical protein
VKGHEGTPGNEKADILAGKAAEKLGYSKVMSLAHLKLQISEKFKKAKKKVLLGQCWPVRRHRSAPNIGGQRFTSRQSARWRRQMLVLPWPSQNDEISCAAVRVLLANPRWEGRFVKFLELSGVGRVVADGTDEDGARAAKMDEWEMVERIAPRGEG